MKEEQIYKAIEVAKACCLKGIKFYGMIGLPTETMEDIQETINLAKRIKERFKGFEISFGFSTFVPKSKYPVPMVWQRECKISGREIKLFTQRIAQTWHSS